MAFNKRGMALLAASMLVGGALAAPVSAEALEYRLGDVYYQA